MAGFLRQACSMSLRPKPLGFLVLGEQARAAVVALAKLSTTLKPPICKLLASSIPVGTSWTTSPNCTGTESPEAPPGPLQPSPLRSKRSHSLSPPLSPMTAIGRAGQRPRVINADHAEGALRGSPSASWASHLASPTAALSGKLLGRLARRSANLTSGLPSATQPGPDQRTLASTRRGLAHSGQSRRYITVGVEHRAFDCRAPHHHQKGESAARQIY